MLVYVGVDLGSKVSNYCIVSLSGDVLDEGCVATSPLEIYRVLGDYIGSIECVGLEATSTSSWIYEGLQDLNVPVVCIETYSLSGVIRAQRNKTDKNDARSIAHSVRTGWFNAVHVKGSTSRLGRSLLASRKALLVANLRLVNSVRSQMKEWGSDPGPAVPKPFIKYAERYYNLDSLPTSVIALITTIKFLHAEYETLSRSIDYIAKKDPICLRLMTMPGIGPITAMAFRHSIDDPSRFRKSRDIGAYLGLTPRRYQSGSTNRQGRISKRGDPSVRTALFMAAHCLLFTCKAESRLKIWGDQLVGRIGASKARIAVARKMAVIMHQMWLRETDFLP